LAGIGSDRLHLAWVSSAEAQRFVEVVTEVTGSIKSQGRFNSSAIAFELNAAEMTLAGDLVRWLVGKELKITSQCDVYGRSWDIERFESILDSVLHREYHKNLVWMAIEQGFTSVRDINRKTGLELEWISRLIAEMEKTNRVVFKGMTDHKPVFAVA
jgi:hypothetical protein